MCSSWKRSQTGFVGVLFANLASLVVIWWYDWQAHALLLAYWLESVIIVVIYVAKIHRAEGTDDPEAIRSWLDIDGERPRAYIGRPNRDIVDAFVEQWAVFVLALGAVITFIPFAEEDIPLEPASPVVVALVAASLVVSHLFSYWYEYLGGREYERRGPVSLLVEPGSRFLALFGATIVGAAVATLTREPTGTIIVLIFFKTCADLLEHRRERKRALRTLEN